MCTMCTICTICTICSMHEMYKSWVWMRTVLYSVCSTHTWTQCTDYVSYWLRYLFCCQVVIAAIWTKWQLWNCMYWRFLKIDGALQLQILFFKCTGLEIHSSIIIIIIFFLSLLKTILLTVGHIFVGGIEFWSYFMPNNMQISA